MSPSFKFSTSTSLAGCSRVPATWCSPVSIATYHYVSLGFAPVSKNAKIRMAEENAAAVRISFYHTRPLILTY